VNDLSFEINLETTLKEAEGLYLLITQTINLPKKIYEITGLENIHAKNNY
jgi:hypothetical protein